MKARICLTGQPDIVCISETHLVEGEAMEISNYKFYGHHRSVRGKRRSGGVAILVKDTVYKEFSVKTCSANQDGILALELTHRITGYTTVVASNYLPPCSSEFGKDPEGFYSCLLTLCYEFSSADMLYLSGDFNSRLGNLQDVIQNATDISER